MFASGQLQSISCRRGDSGHSPRLQSAEDNESSPRTAGGPAREAGWPSISDGGEEVKGLRALSPLLAGDDNLDERRRPEVGGPAVLSCTSCERGQLPSVPLVTEGYMV